MGYERDGWGKLLEDAKPGLLAMIAETRDRTTVAPHVVLDGRNGEMQVQTEYRLRQAEDVAPTPTLDAVVASGKMFALMREAPNSNLPGEGPWAKTQYGDLFPDWEAIVALTESELAGGRR